MSDQRKTASDLSGRGHREETHPRRTREGQQRRAPWVQALAAASPDRQVDASVAQTIHSPGEPLREQTREWFEPRFGHDFSQVRIHADPGAAASAERLQAQAYTVGSHVVFGPGRYAPDVPEGRALLAHELAHVTQQSEGAAPLGRVSQLDAPAESAAERSATRIVAGLSAASAPSAEPGVIHRTVKDDLREAIEGWGTDEEAIYTRLRNASQDEKTAVLSDPVLMQDLYDDLNRSEWGKVLGLLGAGAESRIHAASEGWGTDEEAIYEALRATGVVELKKLIQGSTVLLELRDELDDDELGRALAIIAEVFYRQGMNADVDIYHSLVLFPDTVREAMGYFDGKGLNLAANVLTNLPRGHHMPQNVVDDVETHIGRDNNLARVQGAFEARWNLSLTARAKVGGTAPTWTVEKIRKVHRALNQLPPGHVVRPAQDVAGVTTGEVAAFQLDARMPDQGSWSASTGTIRVGTNFGNIAGLTRHEVGHAMDDFLGAATVTFKQNATNGWSWGGTSTTWETAMANPWRRKDGTQVPAADQAAIKTVLDAYVTGNGKGGLRAGTPAAHAIRTYWNDDVAMIEAAKGLAGKGDDVYQHLGSVKQYGGQYYSWSTYYSEFYVYNAIVQDKRLTNYSLFGHPEFFAEMYEAYYEDGPGASRGQKLKKVANWKQFFDNTVHPTVMT